MDNESIKLLLINKLNLTKIYVTGDNNHINIIAIGDIFKNISSVKRQQIVYEPLINIITEKYIHAVSITAYTNDEWEKTNNQ
ncbi:BolA/IbaG family iron-sulfur metabolism protein [Buchnera aphidicola]|uniref:BolA/IbaG family iron-sulfur metabolism protein n=1 Tax=Buchnera aphidicola subsp. Uroleucon sonchi TaxID=118118 RepID=A0A6C1FCV5_BUCUN|nr:BolA/IbaG family iron-sulfur metabolism protein [Buchnera aphidicola]QIE02086.1 BolA/IbaG family iron-sulfur metabolism protein [Buchnera aphidicola (Uroleucon sonchi)]